MISLLVAGLTALAAATPAVPRVMVAQIAERVALPRAPSSLTVDELSARIELTYGAAARSVGAQLKARLGYLCPIATVEGPRVVLACRTQRLDARVRTEGGRSHLDVYEVRGVPHRTEAQRLKFLYPPDLFLLGGPCPGTTPASRGECAFMAGDSKTAVAALEQALETPQRSYAALRLGDLAVERDDVPAALSWYRRAGTMGPYGRLAAVRMCEISGQCLDQPKSGLFDETALPEPLRTEMLLRRARVAVFTDKRAEAIQAIARTMPPYGVAGGCDKLGRSFCRRLVLYLVETADRASTLAAIELYVTLPGRTQGPLAARLARAVADKAMEIGAPAFGANVLASVAATLDPAEVPEHLLRTAELYVRAQDAIRARVIVEYAETRLGPRVLRQPRWMAVRGALAGSASPDGDGAPSPAQELEVLSAEVTKDVAAAWGALARLRSEQP